MPMGYNPDKLTLRERAEAACRTALLLGSNPDASPDLSDEQLKKALDPQTEPGMDEQRRMVAAPENAIFLSDLLKTYDHSVINSAMQLRTYITNRLLAESDNSDAKIRIKALELLGKITDVGLFTEKTEVTVNNKATSELQNILRQKLEKLTTKDNVVDAIVIPEIREVSMADELAQR